MNLKKVSFPATVKNGKLIMPDREAMGMYVSLWPDNTALTVTLSRERKGRSNQQNAYYWGVIIPILCEWSGYDADEMHDALKWQFLRKEGKIPTVKSTAELSTIEFEEYAAKIRQWSSQEHQIFIPLPSENEIELCQNIVP